MQNDIVPGGNFFSAKYDYDKLKEHTALDNLKSIWS